MRFLIGGALIIIGVGLGQHSGAIRYVDPISATYVLLLGIALALAGVAVITKG